MAKSLVALCTASANQRPTLPVHGRQALKPGSRIPTVASTVEHRICNSFCVADIIAGLDEAGDVDKVEDMATRSFSRCLRPAQRRLQRRLEVMQHMWPEICGSFIR